MKNNQNGMALIVVLGVISVLVATGLHLSRLTNESVIITGQRTDQFTAREMALSAIHLAMALLADDAAENDIDSIQENWADPQILSQMIDQLGYSRGRITLEITDELGKIQVNALLQEYPGHQVNQDQVRLWERLLDLHVSRDRSIDSQNPEVIINALIDWLDSGDNDAEYGLSGAESDYYAGLSVPYASANGVFNHPSELLNVRGVTEDLLSFLPDPRDPDDPENFEEPAPVTLKDVVTVYGLSDLPAGENRYRYPGRININTAGIEVIKALLPRRIEEFAQDLLDYRAQKSEDDEMFLNLLDNGWYNRVIVLSAKEKEVFDRMIRYDSNIFKATSTVVLNRAEVRLSAFILRERQKKTNQWICRIIQMERN
ncbi:MAG: type II secretion system protein GspK [Desulfotignum sp.]|nr:type II secretion system protein GspK [Desulfotignum sp.]